MGVVQRIHYTVWIYLIVFMNKFIENVLYKSDCIY